MRRDAPLCYVQISSRKISTFGDYIYKAGCLAKLRKIICCKHEPLKLTIFRSIVFLRHQSLISNDSKASDLPDMQKSTDLDCASLHSERRTTPGSYTSGHDDNYAHPVPLAQDPREAAALDAVNPIKALSWLDRFLWLWILLAMVLGVILGYFVPNISTVLQQAEFIGVSAPIAVGLMVMMYPILCKVQYEKLHLLLKAKHIWLQLGFSFIVNWIFAPLLMVGLAWAFLPDQRELREGLILVGVARCIAMVLIWTGLAGGDNEYCAILVGFNSILQIVLFAPFAILYITKFVPAGTQAEQFQVSYKVVASSVAAYLGIPLAAAILTRLTLRRVIGQDAYNRYFIRIIGPFSLLGLVFTVIILFASQGRHVVSEIVSVVRTAAPLVVYFAITFFTTLFACRQFKFTYPIAVAQSFTASSNNFELAIAVAIATYGIDSKQALAATVGPLIEIPVLLSLVYLFKYLRRRLVWPEDAQSETSTDKQVEMKAGKDKLVALQHIAKHSNDIVYCILL